MILVLLVTILLGTTVAVSINQNRVMDQHVEQLVKEDLALETEVLELSLAADQMVSSIQEYVISPDNRVETKANFDKAVTNVEGHIESVTTLLEKQSGGELDITVEVNNVFDDIAKLEPLATGNSTSDGVFKTAADQNQILDQVETAVSGVNVHVDTLLDEVTTHSNATILVPAVMDINDAISDSQGHLLHFVIQYNVNDLVMAEYITGISNSSVSGLTEGVMQIPTIMGTIDGALLSTDNTELNQMKMIKSGYSSLKSQFINAINFKKNLETMVHSAGEIGIHLEEEVNDLIDKVHTYTDGQIKELDDSFAQSMIQIISILIGSIILAIALTYWTSKIVVKPVKSVQNAMESVAQGDLTHVLKLEHGHLHTDEIGHLEESLLTMQENLRTLVSAIIQGSNSLTASSEELASAAEETNAATEEVSSTSQSMSQAASQQAEMIAVSVEEITKIGNVVEDIIEQIRHNSDVISQIALQTNILALNAGIEASRAGDYGRGFAVVAENVRRLSEESKKAAEEITEVASSISETLTNAFDTIKIQIEEVAALSEETAASAEEVAAAAEEVTSSMEEVSASSQDLSEQAISSLDEVSTFKVELNHE